MSSTVKIVSGSRVRKVEIETDENLTLSLILEDEDLQGKKTFVNGLPANPETPVNAGDIITVQHEKSASGC